MESAVTDIVLEPIDNGREWCWCWCWGGRPSRGGGRWCHNSVVEIKALFKACKPSFTVSPPYNAVSANCIPFVPRIGR